MVVGVDGNCAGGAGGDAYCSGRHGKKRKKEKGNKRESKC